MGTFRSPTLFVRSAICLSILDIVKNTLPDSISWRNISRAISCGDRTVSSWSNHGPGWDFGRLIVREFKYPYFHKKVKPGQKASANEKYPYSLTSNSCEVLNFPHTSQCILIMTVFILKTKWSPPRFCFPGLF